MPTVQEPAKRPSNIPFAESSTLTMASNEDIFNKFKTNNRIPQDLHSMGVRPSLMADIHNMKGEGLDSGTSPKQTEASGTKPFVK